VTILQGSSLTDVAFAVCSALDRAGVTAVLTGGSAATVYAPDAYQSRDLDFILQFGAAISPPSAKPLLDIGFVPLGRSAMFGHELLPYTLEFPAGPLAVGAEVLTAWHTLRDERGLLHILSPTDCVRDRLAGAIHFRDFSSIRQAVAVASRQRVDLEQIEQWCASEGGGRQYRAFADQLAAGDVSRES
jgi:hypothetical protein